MAQRVDKEAHDELLQDFNRDFPLGSWVLSSGSHVAGMNTFGPYDDVESAFKAGSSIFGVVSWRDQ
jgi:hypothetical protein